jgi:hypothetical protein
MSVNNKKNDTIKIQFIILKYQILSNTKKEDLLDRIFIRHVNIILYNWMHI